MRQLEEFYERTGLFKEFIENHAVSLSNGRLAVDSLTWGLDSQGGPDGYVFVKKVHKRGVCGFARLLAD